MYSFGVILWELLTWRLPWHGTNQFQVMRLVLNGGRPAIPGPEEVQGGGFAGLGDYVALMQRCWAQEPQDRPGFGEVVRCLRWGHSTVQNPWGSQNMHLLANHPACASRQHAFGVRACLASLSTCLAKRGGDE